MQGPGNDLLVIPVLILVVAGQILSKAGAISDSGGLLGLPGFNVLLLGSYLAFLLRGALWSWVLHRNPLGRVYPLLSLAYPLVLGASFVLFNEQLSPGKIIGTLLIIGGSSLLATGEPD